MAPALPDETKDLICDYIAGFSRRVARQTFLSLALTSRAFLGCARRALYTDPFRYTSYHTFENAIPLLLALEAGLGVHVRRLDQLDQWASELDTLATPNDPKRWYELRGQPEGWAWAWALLKASPNVVSLAIPFDTSTQVSKLVKPLRDIKGTLRKLTIRSTPRYTPTHLLILELLASSPHLTLVSLHLANFTFDGTASGRHKKARILTVTLQAISIQSYLDLATISQQLLPGRSSGLRSLELSMGSIHPSDIDDILREVGRKLTTLKLGIKNGYYSPRGLGTYGRNHRGFKLSNDVFKEGALPIITTLEIRYSNSLSLARLHDLSLHSPNLQNVSFVESVWMCDSLATKSDAILPEVELNRIINTWTDLRRVNLGVVPLASGRSYALLEASADRRGWDLNYMTCCDLCPHCGDYH